MKLALFDFDGTLTRHDTLLPFVRHVVGTRHWITGLIALSPLLLAYRLGLWPNHRAKEALLTHFFAGWSADELQQQGENFATQKLPAMLRPDMMAQLREHQAHGDTCLLVSASLDIYLRTWAQAHGFTEVLCSRLEVAKTAEFSNGAITGRLDGANCYGAEKYRRVNEWMAGRKVTHITAYGDSAGDCEMLAMADVALRV